MANASLNDYGTSVRSSPECTMKIVSYVADGEAGYGLMTEDGLRPATDTLTHRYPTVRALLEGDAIDALPQSVDNRVINDFRYQPPVPEPSKILCVGVNYLPHIREMGREKPDYPVVFIRFANSVVGHEEAMIAPEVSTQYDYEGELAVIIGRTTHRVKAADAMSHIAGYCAFNDGSVRDFQRHTPQFTAGKNFFASGAAGPWLTTSDAIDDVRDIQLQTRLNGTVMQNESVSELVFDIPELIEYCSSFARLEAGDILVTGTPGGVGAGRKPPVWLKPGDRVEVDLGPLGSLSNPVVAP